MALGNHIHSQYSSLSGINTFDGEQRIDRGAGSGINAVYRLLSGALADNRAYNLVSQSSGNFAINQANDSNNLSKTVLFYTRDGGLQLFYNGIVQIETTVRGCRLFNLPTSSSGLLSGELWRDTNGFLKVV